MIALLIIGLPGSGKTHLAKKLTTSRPEYVIIDDPKDLKSLDFAISQGNDLIICDPHLCGQSARDGCTRYLEGKGYSIFFLFFENDSLKCERNIRLRADGRVVNVRAFHYDVPSRVRLLPIWQQKD